MKVVGIQLLGVVEDDVVAAAGERHVVVVVGELVAAPAMLDAFESSKCHCSLDSEALLEIEYFRFYPKNSLHSRCHSVTFEDINVVYY